MPNATYCLYQKSVISIHEALEIKAKKSSKPDFTCQECGKPVRPHRSGGQTEAHFEHETLNPECSLGSGYKARKQPRKNYAIDDKKAIEGYRLDAKWSKLYRNQSIVVKCKERDDYTCQACGFKKEINNQYVIECHHLTPLSVKGKSEVSVKDLVCLCPTCHRIAHTSEPPLTPLEIRQLLSK